MLKPLVTTAASIVLLSACNTPSGMIAAFDNSCPAGWSHYEEADGKFLLQVSVDEEGAPIYGITRAGGDTEVSLAVENLPPHDHRIMYRHDAGAGFQAQGLMGHKMTDSNADGMTTHQTGGGQPVELPKPPFWSVNFCKKN